ncbi:MAG: integrase arm-type DNA-binding domain-containing protein [Myxococcota bacterium]
MPLTDKAIKALKPGPKPRKVFDEKGLYLLVSQDGARYWRMKYRVAGREKTYAIGVYPEIGLAAARRRRDEARLLIAEGGDPSAVKQAAKVAQAETFEGVAREWLAKESGGWAPAHAKKVKQRFERDLFPRIGSRPVNQLQAPEILEAVRRIASRGAIETAHRALWGIGQVMRFAVQTSRAPGDPTPALRGALPPAARDHFAAITDPDDLGDLLVSLEAFQGQPATMAALKLAPRLFVRPGELRRMEWSEVDLDAEEGALWSIPGDKMKRGEPHLVPLAKQCVDILRDLAPLTRRSPFAFPNLRSPKRPLSDVALTAALRRLGYEGDEVTIHGFRATARTLLDEALHEPVHLIEHQLAHTVRDPLGRAYNRTQHLPERRKMMQRWSDYLDELRDAARGRARDARRDRDDGGER